MDYDNLYKLLKLLQFGTAKNTIELRNSKIKEKTITFASNKGYISGNIENNIKDTQVKDNYVFNYIIKRSGYDLFVKMNTEDAIKLLKKTTLNLSKETSKINTKMLTYTQWLLYLTIVLLVTSIINIWLLLK